MVNLLLFMTLSAVLSAAPTPCGKPKTEQMTHNAEVVFVGEVVEVERPSILAWSGLTLYRQHVRYKVNAVLKGKLSEKELWIGYPIYYGSLLADKEVPQLSPEVFKTGGVHLVFMKHVKELSAPPFSSRALNPSAKPAIKSPYGPVDVNCGALTYSPDVEGMVRRIASRAVK